MQVLLSKPAFASQPAYLCRVSAHPLPALMDFAGLFPAPSSVAGFFAPHPPFRRPLFAPASTFLRL